MYHPISLPLFNFRTFNAMASMGYRFACLVFPFDSMCVTNYHLGNVYSNRNGSRGDDGRSRAHRLPVADRAFEIRKRLEDAVKKRPAAEPKAQRSHRSVHRLARAPLPQLAKRRRV